MLAFNSYGPALSNVLNPIYFNSLCLLFAFNIFLFIFPSFVIVGKFINLSYNYMFWLFLSKSISLQAEAQQ